MSNINSISRQERLRRAEDIFAIMDRPVDETVHLIHMHLFRPIFGTPINHNDVMAAIYVDYIRRNKSDKQEFIKAVIKYAATGDINAFFPRYKLFIKNHFKHTHTIE